MSQVQGATATTVPASVTATADARWEAFARREPYFVVFPASRFLRANLTPAIEREFFAGGEARVDAILRTIELRLAPHFAPTRVLEYGCGVGRLALPLASRAARTGGHVLAIDRSPAMLEVLRHHAASRDLTNLECALPDALFESARRFDFVNCYLVFQRIAPADGLLLLAALLRQLGRGGIGAFQVPYRSGTSRLVAASRSLRERVPAANRALNRLRKQSSDQPFFPSHLYDMTDVLRVFQDAGCAATHVVFDDHDDLQSVVILAEMPAEKRAATTTAVSASAEAHGATAPETVGVSDLIAARSLGELNDAAERYYTAIGDWERHLAKPFSSVEDAASILPDVSVVFDALRLVPGATVLEFGAGTGWLSRWLTQLDCRVILLDVSTTALDMARELYTRLPPIGDRPAPSFLRFDGVRIDLPDASVDRIVSFHAFHHVPNPEAVLAEMSRVLKPGGLAAFVEPGEGHSTTGQSQFEMRTFGVVENDIDLHALWDLARIQGFRDVTLMASGGRAVAMSLREFDDLLAGGATWEVLTANAREHLRNTRHFVFVKAGVERVDSRDARALGCDIQATLVGRATAHAPHVFDVTVTNRGPAVWLPRDAPYGGVSIGVHVHGGAGDSGEAVEAAILPDRLTTPARDVVPGETLKVRVSLAPRRSGRYTFEFDCVASRVSWFEQAGSRPSAVVVVVEDP